MTEANHAPSVDLGPAPASPARPFSEVPSIGWKLFLQRIMNGDEERNDMHAGLRRAYEAHGPVSKASAIVFNMVNLFGPDANRQSFYGRI